MKSVPLRCSTIVGSAVDTAIYVCMRAQVGGYEKYRARADAWGRTRSRTESRSMIRLEMMTIQKLRPRFDPTEVAAAGVLLVGVVAQIVSSDLGMMTLVAGRGLTWTHPSPACSSRSSWKTAAR